MNLYSRKQRWKIVLFIAAVAIASSSLFYTSYITDKIKQDERLRIKIWSDAIRIQVNQLYLTNKLFDKVKSEEEKKVRLWAKAMQELGKDITDYTFALEVIQDNTTVPVILTDNQGNFSSSINTDISFEQVDSLVKLRFPDKPSSFYTLKSKEVFNDSIQQLKQRWMKKHSPIAIGYKGKIINYVFYKESKIYDELQRRKDSIASRFNHELINNAALVPVIFTDSTKTKVLASNLDSAQLGKELKARLAAMSKQNTPITVQINEKEKGYIFYEDSKVLAQLKMFPYIQTVIVGIFLLITYLIFNTFKAAEQNQVWAGMAKETAHQLGTPLSSLMAWNELLRASGTDKSITDEIEKDVLRLNTITDRFSKIGSEPTLEETDLSELIVKFIDYLKPRVSSKVILNADQVPFNVKVHANGPLLEWVLENLSKNAIDAMEGQGSITYVLTRGENQVILDITDTGKGIPHNKFKTIFKPGYSTKKRGWGLGLTLVKRIVEEYHKGKIFVLKSDPQSGTTFRLILK